MPHPYLVFKILKIIFLSQTRSNFIIMAAITNTENFQNSIVVLSQNLYSVCDEAALFEQLGNPRPRFPSTKRTATFAYVLSHSPLSSLSRFSDKLYLPSRCEELGLGEPVHARTESRGECRFTQNRSPFLRDCWPTDRKGERKREGNTSTTRPLQMRLRIRWTSVPDTGKHII